MRILTDYHHDGLLESLYRLFEGRLGHELYRPIGLEWFEKGYWAINNQRDTAEQYLAIGSTPEDGTPPLNNGHIDGNVYKFYREGYVQKAVTFDTFLKNDFDIIIASIPQHIAPFRELAAMKKAKFIFQVGNDWDLNTMANSNVLASIKPRPIPDSVNVLFYHQEFDTAKFHMRKPNNSGKIYSFINILQNMNQAWEDFTTLEKLLKPHNFEFRSFGGQCRDGNIDGAQALADKMAEAMFIFHVKPGGDGYGHVLHNAYSVGRPIITRKSHYYNKLGSALMATGTLIDLDEVSHEEAAKQLIAIRDNPNTLSSFCTKAGNQFASTVYFDQDAERVKLWLKNLV